MSKDSKNNTASYVLEVCNISVFKSLHFSCAQNKSFWWLRMKLFFPTPVFHVTQRRRNECATLRNTKFHLTGLCFKGIWSYQRKWWRERGRKERKVKEREEKGNEIEKETEMKKKRKEKKRKWKIRKKERKENNKLFHSRHYMRMTLITRCHEWKQAIDWLLRLRLWRLSAFSGGIMGKRIIWKKVTSCWFILQHADTFWGVWLKTLVQWSDNRVKCMW